MSPAMVVTASSTLAQPFISWRRRTSPTMKPWERPRVRRVVRAAIVEARPSPVPSDGPSMKVVRVFRGVGDRAEDLQAEARAMERAVNASVYSPELLSNKYGSRPIKVLISFFFSSSFFFFWGDWR